MGLTPILRSQPMSYATGCHTVFHHRYHIVWVTKYRYKVLEGALRERIRTIIRQVCKELGVQIVSGVLSKEHVHMFVEIPPHICQPSTLRMVICPEAIKAQNNIAAVSAEGRTVWVLIRRLNSSCKRSIAFDVRIDFHWLLGNRVKVKSLSPASSRLAATAWHFTRHLRMKALRFA